MSQHLEIYSSHRNRQQDPLPSHFTIPFGSSPLADPVLNGVIYYQWGNSAGFINAGKFRQGTTPKSLLLDLCPSFPPSVFIPVASQPLTQPIVENAYTGYEISIFNYNNFQQKWLISGYQPGKTEIQLARGVSFANPGDFYLINDRSVPNLICIPYQDDNGNLASPIENTYASYYLVDETLSTGGNLVYRVVTYYDASNRYLYLDRPFPNTWSISDRYTLRKSLPYQIWNLQTSSDSYTFINYDPSYGPIGPVIFLPEGASNVNDFYKGQYVYYASNTIPGVTTSSRAFQGYNGAFYITSYRVTYQPSTQTYKREAFLQWDINSTRLPYTLLSSGLVFAAGTVPQAITIPANDPHASENGFYVGYQVLDRVTNQTRIVMSHIDRVLTLQSPFYVASAGSIAPGSSLTTIYLPSLPQATQIIGLTFYHSLGNGISEIRRIIAFDPSQMTVTLDTPLTLAAGSATVVGDPYEISSTREGNPYVITTPSTINIVSLASNNVVPLDYIGTMTSIETSVCYEVELESISLPNLTLVTGSQIAFYPYIYVELRNLSASESSSPAIFYSNNPPSSRAIFIVPITDVINPNSGYFVKLTGNSPTVLKFKPNDNLLFSVTLPNGRLVETTIPDLFTPYPPSEFLQIHATFSLKRL